MNSGRDRESERVVLPDWRAIAEASDRRNAERRALVPAYERLRRLTSQAASDGGGKTRAPAFSDGPRLEELAHLFGAVGGRIWAEVREQSDERLERYFRGECS